MKGAATLLLAIAAIVVAPGVMAPDVHAQQTGVAPTPCPTPRPSLPCPDVYKRAPVCGVKTDGSKVTYLDYCQACSRQDVRAYTLGACDGSKDK
jgi:hypothetical protein